MDAAEGSLSHSTCQFVDWHCHGCRIRLWKMVGSTSPSALQDIRQGSFPAFPSWPRSELISVDGPLALLGLH